MMENRNQAQQKEENIIMEEKKQKKQNEVKDHDSVVQRMSHSNESAQKIEDKDPYGDCPCVPFSLP